jgi:hypothetical protein
MVYGKLRSHRVPVPRADETESDVLVMVDELLPAGYRIDSVGGSALRSHPTSRGKSSEAVR